MPRPSQFTSEKDIRYPLDRRLARPQGRSGPMQKISPPLGFDSRTLQPVASRCTENVHSEMGIDFRS